MSHGQPELLWGLPPDDSARVSSLAAQVRFASGATLFELGADAETVYVLGQGRIALTLPVTVGGRHEDILVEERQAGQTVGWSALIPPHRFTLKAAALVDTEALAFSRATLLDLFAADPALGYTVTRNLASVIGHRLTVFQAMWMREVQRLIDARSA
jgi:CRP/FNR family transcriptional regulator, cyclic AMP receptor protein